MIKLSQFTTVWPSVTAVSSTSKDGIIVQGRDGGSGAFRVTLSPSTLTANRSILFPNVSGTVVTTGDEATVSGVMIAQATITGLNLAAKAVDTFNIADEAVDTLQLANESVTKSKLAPNVVAPVLSPYVLYVNPVTGSDSFAGGTVVIEGDTEDAQKLKCGYSENRPFKTINRAIIEAGILTAKSYYESPLANNDLVSIVLAPGVYTVLNGAGSTSVPEWPLLKEPTNAELQAFNPSVTGGTLLPRGVSLCSIDLRKTILRPDVVPEAADEVYNGSGTVTNRRSIFKVTGTGYYFGLTFMDKVGLNASHHLLHCFEFASQVELDEFYTKIRQAFGGPNNTGGINNALAVTRTSEYEIVGPQPPDGSQTIATDTTLSASPYVFNCSIRSNYGLCGIYADGSKTSGFKSMVVAQFTGVSLQRDLSCWQKYSSILTPRWGTYFSSYEDYINTDPDDVRMNISRRSFHIRAVNNAVIQEVSVFAIGQGIHHWCENGGEITVTNSNSNFGGCCALATGYKSVAFRGDSNWNVSRIRVASNLADKSNNVRKIYLGTINSSTANNATAINLEAPLEPGRDNSLVPLILDRDGYSLVPNSYIWVENNRGQDYRAQLTSSAWSAGSPSTINVSSIFQNESGIKPGDDIINSQGYDTGQNWPDLAGARIYVRRLQDVRTTDERRFSLRCGNSLATARTPVRDYVIQTTPGSEGMIGTISDSSVLTVSFSANVATEGSGVAKASNVELRRSNGANPWTANSLYLPGDVVVYDSKHYSCIAKNTDSTFSLDKWEESYVHMSEAYFPGDYWKNSQLTIIFDGDTDSSENSATCGYNLATVWSTDVAIQRQYRASSDYRGLHSFLMGIGFSSANAHTILLPRAASSRERNPSTPLDGIAPPNGASTAWINWSIEFRRPSNIRLFGHAWEWSGFLNYTKSIPSYQKELSPSNKFTYYLTNRDGGRVYGSGFNEEGYVVTPQGLQDITTGDQIAVENIADTNVPIDEISFPTFYDELTVNTLNINSRLNLNGTVSGSPNWEGGYGSVLPALPNASTTNKGVIEIATPSEVQEFLRDDLAVTPATLIQALGDAIKSVVNLRLSLSPTSPVPSQNQLNSTNVYIHPYNGSEIALYNTATLRWQIVEFSGVKTFSLAPANGSTVNYDIYVYNSGTTLSPTLALEYVIWPLGNPPVRGVQDGVLVRDGNPSRRLIGVVRTTNAGTSTIDLGGLIYGATSENYPKVYLANLYNLYDCRAVYFFGNGWTAETTQFSTPPSSVYPFAPRISWIQAGETLVTAFLDIYNNWTTSYPAGQGPVCYVAPGIDTTTYPPADSFFGECRYTDTTAGSQWVRSLPAGPHNIYYLYQNFQGPSTVNEHPYHGMIVTFKV